MADFNVPPIAAQAGQTVPKVNIGELVGTMQGLQAYKQAQQMNPLQVQEQQARTRAAQLGLSTEKFLRVINAETSMINDPLVRAAEQNPSAVNRDELIKKIQSHGQDTGKALGLSDEEVGNVINPLIDIVKANPAGLRLRMTQDLLKGIGGAGAAGLLQPSGPMISSGAGGAQVQTGLFGPGPGELVPGTAYQATVGPQARYEMGTDAAGQPIVIERDIQGRPVGMYKAPTGVPGAAGQLAGAIPSGAGAAEKGGMPPPPPVPEPAAFPTAAGGKGAVEESQKLFVQARQTAANAPNVINTSNRIIDLADQVIAGKGAGVFAALGGGYAGLPWTSNATEAYNRLGHDIALQTQNMAQSGAYGTDAGRELASELAGKKDWDEKSIKSVSRLNRAMGTASQLFGQGVEMAAQQNPNNPQVAADFRSQWAKTMGTNGLDAIRLWDAYQNQASDPQGLQEVVRELGGKDSAKYKAAYKRFYEITGLLGIQ